jgi:protein translocase SecG subunit
MSLVLQIIQAIISIILIVAIMFQTTKSEAGAGMSGMGWGSIGGKSQSSLGGHWGSEEHIGQITTWVAVGFIVVSFLTALVYTK